MVECSFLELKCKEVINVVDGRRLGHIVDMIFDLNSGVVMGLIVPGNKSLFSFLKGGNEIYIPFTQVCKIGSDTILVELYGPAEQNTYAQGQKQVEIIRN